MKNKSIVETNKITRIDKQVIVDLEKEYLKELDVINVAKIIDNEGRRKR